MKILKQNSKMYNVYDTHIILSKYNIFWIIKKGVEIK